MNVVSPELLIMVLIGSLYCILMKVININRDRSGIAIKAIKSKKKISLLTDVVIIVVVILFLITSSGCSTKEPTTIINNNVKQEQAASEAQPSEESLLSEGAQSSEEALLSEGSQPSEETSSLEETPKPDIEIIHPVEKTNWKENIGGIARNIPEGYELWVIVYSPEKQQYYPYTKAVPQHDQWVTRVTIGFRDDTVEEFDIIAVLADTEAQEIFNDYLDAKEENKENIYSQGMYLIPDGAKEYSRVTLERRNMFDDDTLD